MLNKQLMTTGPAQFGGVFVTLSSYPCSRRGNIKGLRPRPSVSAEPLPPPCWTFRQRFPFKKGTKKKKMAPLYHRREESEEWMNLPVGAHRHCLAVSPWLLSWEQNDTAICHEKQIRAMRLRLGFGSGADSVVSNHSQVVSLAPTLTPSPIRFCGRTVMEARTAGALGNERPLFSWSCPNSQPGPTNDQHWLSLCSSGADRTLNQTLLSLPLSDKAYLLF